MAGDEPPDSDELETREVLSLSPEARRLRAQQEAHLSPLTYAQVSDAEQSHQRTGVASWLGPDSGAWEVTKRTLIGAWNDGFIHAGNLAYLSMLAIFPFFIFATSLFEIIGEAEERRAVIDTVLIATPVAVRNVIEPVAMSVIDARSGWLLWLGAFVGLWTVSSLIETIRDILRRAYGTQARLAFWKYRLASAGLIVGAVILLMLSFFVQVVIGAVTEMLDTRLPGLADLMGTLQLSRIIPALSLFGSLYVLFYTLTPQEYRRSKYPKWPGALLTAIWWVAVTVAMPAVLGAFFTYDLTYGSLAGIMIALFFFWLVGLGLVIGAELNAALAEPEVDNPSHSGTDHLESERLP